MTLAQFIAAHQGKYLDYDGHFSAQCVDLIDFYCVQVLGVPIAWANAVDWYGRDAPLLGWSRNVWGNRGSKPSAGAIVVWGANVRAGTGQYGHIAICTDPGDGLTFGAFSQNYPPRSPCALRRFTYDGVIGWGAKPAPPPPAPVDPCAPLRVELAAAQGQLAAYRATVAAWVAGAPK